MVDIRFSPQRECSFTEVRRQSACMGISGIFHVIELDQAFLALTCISDYRTCGISTFLCVHQRCEHIKDGGEAPCAGKSDLISPRTAEGAGAERIPVADV